MQVIAIHKGDNLFLWANKGMPISDADKNTLYHGIQQQGYQISNAEVENIALCSCDEILKDTQGNLFYHQGYEIRDMIRELKGKMAGLLILPRIEFEED